MIFFVIIIISTIMDTNIAILIIVMIKITLIIITIFVAMSSIIVVLSFLSTVHLSRFP